MKNITINGRKKTDRLEKELSLKNGSLVLVKDGETITQVYMVVSFRDNKNCYNGQSTTPYCSLVNLDTGYFAFEERCSRETTVRRVLNHILRVGPFVGSPESVLKRYGAHDVEVKYSGEFKVDISI